MKTNQEFKSEARAALNGNWAQAVIATIIFMLLVSALCGPRYASVLNVSAGSPLILPAYVTYGGTLLIVLVLYPLAAGFLNSFRILFERMRKLDYNEFKLCQILGRIFEKSI